MATQSTWRVNNAGSGPRWGSGATGGAGGARSGGQAQNQQQASNGSATASSTNGSAAFPPLGNKAAKLDEEESAQRDRTMYLLVGLVGNTIEATTRSGAKYVGILSSTSTPENGQDSLGVVLSCAQQILPDNALGPLKKTLLIKGEELDSFVARDVGLDVPVSMNRDERTGFCTDTEISKTAADALGQGRTLQKWAVDGDTDMSLEGGTNSSSSKGALGGWDQFATNEAKFGIKSNYEETMYTTKLDRSTKDFRERERKADQLAREIMSSTTNNIHVAEERGLNDSDAAQTEEDKYGAVARGSNAYVPPPARRAAAATASASISARINGAAVPAADKVENDPTSAAPSIVTTAPATSAGTDGTRRDSAAERQQQQDAVGEFRQFVSQERERMERKKAALAKKEKDMKLAELKSWSNKFKLSFPVPQDVAMVKQQSKDKADVPRASEKPRDPNLQKSLSPAPAHAHKTQATGDASGSASAVHSPITGSSSRASTAAANALPSSSATRLAETKALLAKMTIPKIPPFNAEKTRARPPASPSTAAPAGAIASNATAATAGARPDAGSDSKSIFKMSVKANTFKPFNPNAASFMPGASTTASSRVSADASPAASSPALKPATATNPFFGNRPIKKTPATLHVREEFNPFKTGKVPDASTIGPMWGFTGKPYRQLFHVIPAEDVASTSHTPQQHHPTIMQMAGAGLPPGVHSPMGQQPPAPHLGQPQLHHHHHQQQQQQPGHHIPQHGQGMPHNNAGGQSIYMPYGPYRFQGGQQPVQHIGGPYMTPQFVAQMPFSPPMPPNGPPTTLYSPQMQNMMPAPPPSMVPGGGPPRGGAQGPPHMQPKVPPHMYYAAAQPMPGMPYGAPFPPSAGPSPVVRHQQHHPAQQPLPPPPPHHAPHLPQPHPSASGGAPMVNAPGVAAPPDVPLAASVSEKGQTAGQQAGATGS